MNRRYALIATVVSGIQVLNLPSTAFVGLPFSHQLLAFGGEAPYTWELRSVLPPHWAFDPATATLSASGFSNVGVFAVTLYVHDFAWDNELEITFNIRVVAPYVTSYILTGDGHIWTTATGKRITWQ